MTANERPEALLGAFGIWAVKVSRKALACLYEARGASQRYARFIREDRDGRGQSKFLHIGFD